MKVPFADFRAHWAGARDELIEAFERVGASGWLVLGAEVSSFEQDLASAWGMNWAAGCANGLDALEIALRAEGVRPGDRVLTTPLSAFATTLAILRAGAVPVFADVDASGLLDLESAEELMAGDPIRFIMPVHLFGHAMDLVALEAFATRHDLVVIEDCAQAIGARSHGRAVGTVGRLCATSFYPTKNLGAYGDGGAVLGNDSAHEAVVRSLRDYGQAAKYEHVRVGMNSRLDELQAALLRTVQLPRLAEQTKRRNQIAARYRESLSHPNVVLPPAPEGSESVWHLFPVLVEGDRSKLAKYLAENGIATAVHYPILIPDQPAMGSSSETQEISLDQARRFAAHELSLPIHPFLSDSQVDYVVETVNRWGQL